MNKSDVNEAVYMPLAETMPDRIIDNGAKVEIEKGEVFVTADKPVSEVKLIWNCNLTGTRVLGDQWERTYGDTFWRPVTIPRDMPWYFLCKVGTRTDCYGVMTQPNAFASWRTDGKTLTLTLDLRAAGQPVVLNGRRLKAVTLVSRHGREGESAFDAGTEFCRMMCPSPRLPNAPVYGYNDWYCAYGKQTAEGFLRDAAPVVALCEGLENRPYAVVDDGWQRDGAQPGYGWGEWAWTESSPHFGMGMKSFAAKVAALGAKPGLWYRPLIAWPGAPADELQTCNKKMFDPTLPSVIDRIEADIRRFREWGMKLVKIDFLTCDLNGLWICDYGDDIGPENFMPSDRVWHDNSRTSAEVIKALYTALRESAGDDMVIIGCNAINHLAAGLFEAERTGDDTSGLDWFQTVYNGVNTLAMRSIQNGTFFQTDPDCIGLARKDAVDWKLNAQWLDAVARSGQALFVSWKSELMNEDVRDALRKAYATASVPRSNGEPLDWEKHSWPREWNFADGKMVYDWSDDIQPAAGSHLTARFANVGRTMLEIGQI